MNKKYLALIGRIEEELLELEQVVERVRAGWFKAKESGEDLYLDSVALNLHAFYAGLERIFELIAVNVDQTKPEAKAWHQELLRQMSAEIKHVRPPVISRETRNKLDEYRGFRHVVRNVYIFNLSAAKMEPLVKNIKNVFEQVKKEIQEFNRFVEKADSKDV
ncbi:hypothetical protein M1N06_04170 [Peptococcaceae bacterium]|nr:hypothetical protein [Peptococcaceae bacterium]